jgi:hypothetical protein
LNRRANPLGLVIPRVVLAGVDRVTSTRANVSTSVEQVAHGLGDEPVEAGKIVADLLQIHPEYGGGSGQGLRLTPSTSDRRPPEVWFQDVQSLFSPDLVELVDGRSLIAGLGLLDRDLWEQLSKGRFLDRIVKEIEDRRAQELGERLPFDFLLNDEGKAIWLGLHPTENESLRPKSPGRPSLQMLADRPLDDEGSDRLRYEPYADALANLIDHSETDTPLCIAISAPWGAGKTTLAKMVERRLKSWPRERGDLAHLTHWFNAWMNDDAPHLGSAFAADLARAANQHRPMWRRFLLPLPSAMLTPSQRWRRTLLLAATAVAVSGLIVFFAQRVGLFEANSDLVELVDKGFGGALASVVGAAVLVVGLWPRVFSVAKQVAGFVDDPRSEAARGSMQQVSTQLGRLLRQATRGKRRFVIFVDDLERCSPSKALEVCQVANLLLGHRDVVTVLIADMSSVASSAEAKYQGDASKGDYGWGRSYLQKIVQIQFDLPPPGPSRLQKMLTQAVDAPSDFKFHEPTAGSGIAGVSVTSIRSAVEAVAWASVVLAVVLFLSGSGLRGTSWFGDFTPALVGLAPAVIGLGLGLLGSFRDRSRRDTAERIDQQIHSMAKAGEQDPAALRDGVLRSDVVKEGKTQLIDQRVQRLLTDEYVLRQQAESEIVAFLPPLPRNAKRVLNHLRVLLTIAIGRDMFGGTPELEAKHLAKWIVLSERWPEVAWAVAQDPHLMKTLEAARDVNDLRSVMDMRDVHVRGIEELVRFLQGETKLEGVAERLAFFEPAGRENTSSR